MLNKLVHVVTAGIYVFNPYPANVENMVRFYQCWQMADGI